MKYDMPFNRLDWSQCIKQTSLALLVFTGVLMSVRFIITGIFHLVF